MAVRNVATFAILSNEEFDELAAAAGVSLDEIDSVEAVVILVADSSDPEVDEFDDYEPGYEPHGVMTMTMTRV